MKTIWPRVQPYTMTSPERVQTLLDAVDTIVTERIPGDIVECGVWKGGSMMAAALRLIERGDTSRDLWLYDTFEGMTEPGERDVDFAGNTAASQLAAHPFVRAVASLDEVMQHMLSTGYPGMNLCPVPGDVLQTIPLHMPGRIALLRLDTDWYGSTRHELEHLWPLVSSGGFLIVDDYGWWGGCRDAVDEWNATLDEPVELHHIDDIGVWARK